MLDSYLLCCADQTRVTQRFSALRALCAPGRRGRLGQRSQCRGRKRQGRTLPEPLGDPGEGTSSLCASVSPTENEKVGRGELSTCPGSDPREGCVSHPLLPTGGLGGLGWSPGGGVLHQLEECKPRLPDLGVHSSSSPALVPNSEIKGKSRTGPSEWDTARLRAEPATWSWEALVRGGDDPPDPLLLRGCRVATVLESASRRPRWLGPSTVKSGRTSRSPPTPCVSRTRASGWTKHPVSAGHLAGDRSKVKGTNATATAIWAKLYFSVFKQTKQPPNVF